MSATQNQHYLPQSYQRGWADASDKVHVYQWFHDKLVCAPTGRRLHLLVVGAAVRAVGDEEAVHAVDLPDVCYVELANLIHPHARIERDQRYPKSCTARAGRADICVAVFVVHTAPIEGGIKDRPKLVVRERKAPVAAVPRVDDPKASRGIAVDVALVDREVHQRAETFQIGVDGGVALRGETEPRPDRPQIAAEAPQKAVATVEPTCLAKPSEKTLRTLLPIFLNDATKVRGDKVRMIYNHTIPIVGEVLGMDTPLRSIDREACRRLMDMLRWLPTNSKKRFSKMTAVQASEMAKANKLTSTLGYFKVVGDDSSLPDGLSFVGRPQ
jgi:hypothetical protein